MATAQSFEPISLRILARLSRNSWRMRRSHSFIDSILLRSAFHRRLCRGSRMSMPSLSTGAFLPPERSEDPTIQLPVLAYWRISSHSSLLGSKVSGSSEGVNSAKGTPNSSATRVPSTICERRAVSNVTVKVNRGPRESSSSQPSSSSSPA